MRKPEIRSARAWCRSRGRATLRSRGIRTVSLLAAALMLWAVAACGGGGSDERLRLVAFNLENVQGVFLNERLVFEFNAPVDPASVDVNTIQIRVDASRVDLDGDCFADESANTDLIVDGAFAVEGKRVFFQPRIPIEEGDTIGLYPEHDIASDPSPIECIRDTRLVLVFRVFVPGLAQGEPVTLTTANDGKPLVDSYNAVFTTVYDPLFPFGISSTSFTDTVRGAPRFEGLVAPVDGGGDVERDAVVVAKFSEPLFPPTVRTDTIFLSAVGPNTGREQWIPSTFDIDFARREIRLIPTVGLPAGVEISFNFTDELADFGGNLIEIPEDFVYPTFRTADAPLSGPFVVREDFSSDDRRDFTETSARWNALERPGWLLPVEGGGTAMNGRLVLDPLESTIYTLDTGAYDPSRPLPSFDYSDVHIGRFATLRVSGENPLVIKSLRDIVVEGTIDVSGRDAGRVGFAAEAGTPGGAGGPGGGGGGNGGSFDGEDGGKGLGARNPATGVRVAGGGEGSLARTCATRSETGGGGGGEHSGGAEEGRGDRGNANGGGLPGEAYGNPDLDPFAGRLLGGSGGGGAGATCFDDVLFPGSGGGGGGGAVWLQALGEIAIVGEIWALGGAGGDNESVSMSGGEGGATGGGGSGGAILLQGLDRCAVTDDASVIATRGIGGQPVEGGGFANGRGGAGGRGRNRVESSAAGSIDIAGIAFRPATTTGTYRRDGNSSVATSLWIDTRAFFPDFSAVRGGRDGGPLDQDNGARFPDPDRAVRYLYQGASTDPENPFRPNLDDLRPGAGQFTPNIDEVDDSRFIRVKVVLSYPYPDIGVEPQANFFEIRYSYRGEAEF